MKYLKLIWDFKGPYAERTAAHHYTHLQEYALTATTQVKAMGTQAVSNNHHTAYMVVHEDSMPIVRDALRPHRGQVYEE